MVYRSPTGTTAVKVATLMGALATVALITVLGTVGARSGEDAKYPDMRGQWNGVLRTVQGLPGQPSFDPNKPWGKGQQAPLTPEYQAILEANLKSQADGELFDWRGAPARASACR